MIGHLIALVVICNIRQIVTNDVSNHTICQLIDRFQIISIFKLKNDIYIQIDKVGEELWHLDLSSVDKYGQVSIKPMLYKDITFASNIRQMLSIGMDVDLREPVRAHIFDIEDMAQKCVNSSTPECKEVLGVVRQWFSNFVCIYATSKTNRLSEQIVIALKYETNDNKGKRFEFIRNKNLENNIRHNCYNSRERTANISSKAYKAKYISTLSLSYLPILQMNWLNVSLTETIDPKILRLYAFEGQNKSAFTTEVNTTQSYHLFQLNEYQDIYACPQYCSYKSNLAKLSSSNEALAWDISETNIQFNDILRCNEESTRFEAHIFCAQEIYESIFNLGKDTYFKNGGIFWRFSASSFYSDSKLIKTKLTGIIYDSDIADFLYKNSFDLTSKLFGFTFKSGVHYSCKHTKNKTCTHFHHFPQYERTCIVGMDASGYPHNQTVLIGAYEYTTTGLKRFDSDVEKANTFVFCFSVFQSLNITDKNSSCGDNQLKSITAYAVDSDDLGLLFLLFDSKKKHFFYQRIIISTKETMNWGNFQTTPRESNVTKEWTNIFYFDGLKEYFAVDSNGKQFYRFNPKTTAIQSERFLSAGRLFECPFNQSHSIIPLHIEGVCPKNRKYYESEENKSNSISLFNIGSKLYYQTGMYFYLLRFNRFHYDKHVSNILKQYFDIRYRITGYSVPKENEPKKYIVILEGHCKAPENEYMFAAFKVDESTVDSFAPINDPNEMKNRPNITYGSKGPNGWELPVDVLGSGHAPDGMFYVLGLDRHSGWRYVLFISTDMSQSEWPFIPKVFEEKKWKYMVKNGWEVEWEVFVAIVSFPSDIGLKLIAWSRAKPRKLLVYNMNNFWNGFEDFQLYGDFDQLFCLPKALESNSSANPLVYILLCSILLLLLIAIFVGFLANCQNISNELNDKNESKHSVRSKESFDKNSNTKQITRELNETITEVKTENQTESKSKFSDKEYNDFDVESVRSDEI